MLLFIHVASIINTIHDQPISLGSSVLVVVANSGSDIPYEVLVNILSEYSL
jgi:hypothetical protein